MDGTVTSFDDLTTTTITTTHFSLITSTKTFSSDYGDGGDNGCDGNNDNSNNGNNSNQNYKFSVHVDTDIIYGAFHFGTVQQLYLKPLLY